ncbi:O-linked N-acetylglucosamine transferase, SPINDLY family protein [Massilia yuzhufengensis]|uniref:protein O-GlcNAc transferase n=1 Tax=Massilia yuzhufengensis TaxID=1164594 RepID=A0A1I1G5H9_9BURK|nr:tetratricopeptide repeat protein [Massilia yuzhufengensis]SFC06997.1 Predicted O-linked N-acetylglucosamine transferase, SPINDLY family [Massilia yuzhufengensis]
MTQPARPAAPDPLAQHRLAVQRNPRDANAHALLGLSLLKARRLEDGVASLRRALELNPKARGIHAVLAAALFELERFEDAAGAYRSALRFQDDADLHQGLADALLRLGRTDEAEPAARRAVALAPGNTGCLLSLAAVLHKDKNMEETVLVLQQVLALEPDNFDARADLGNQLYQLHRHEEAAACLGAVLEQRPDNLASVIRLAQSHRVLKRFAQAVEGFRRAVALAPDRIDLVVDLANTLRSDGQLPEAATLLQGALALEPDNVEVLHAIVGLSFGLGEWEEALRLARRALELAPSPAAHSVMLFILSHYCMDAGELTREHFAYGQRWEPELQALQQPHANDRDPERKIRVGFVSADMYEHAVTRFVTPVFDELRGHERVELYVYYNNNVHDAMTAHLRACTTGWRSISLVDDASAERMIREDGIDILVDLSGHSSLNRLPLFMRKPAPVQLTWIGYAGTTGMRTMDYIVSDPFVLPAGRYDDQYTERVLRLPLAAPFLPDPGAPPVNELPAARNGHLTFGSFHRASKLSREVIAQWARLLHAVPDAKMLLGGLQPGVDDVLVDWFAQEGVPRERLLLRQRTNVHGYLKQHYEVDVCLSPFPYSGSTTIGHALWMGVPTLATVGATNPSHAAVSFLAHLGLRDFITEDEDTYVKLGVFLSQNTGALAAMRATMRERFVNSVLGYPGVTAAGLEHGLRLAWRRWCAGQPAADLQVRLADLAQAPA